MVVLIARIFVVLGSGPDTGQAKGTPREKEKNNPKKGVPKELGEYVDYEEVGKKS
ncbi:MAG: hypothetical protein U0T33_10950 [Bacteroidales bacterium]